MNISALAVGSSSVIHGNVAVSNSSPSLMNYDDLLPCPFCGSAKHLRYEFAGSQGYICCDNCGTQGPCDERAADPICDYYAAYAAWNRRAALAEPEGGADQELEACIEVILSYPGFESPELFVEVLRDVRRPKPPSLKEQALQALNRFMDTEGHEGCTADDIADDYYLIRKAVESLSS